MSAKSNHLLIDLLKSYPAEMHGRIELSRQVIQKSMPGITEEVDLSAKMIAYCYGPKYSQMICAVFPSKAGLKLSFYRGVDLPDPKNLLEGAAKTTRYLSFKNSAKELPEKTITGFLEAAQEMYLQRVQP